MATYTTNYNLKKPEYGDAADIADINDNMEIIDGQMHANATGVIPVSRGGTGQTTVADARGALGLGNTDGALPVANGGTGQTTVAAARNALGLGNTTGALPVANGGTGKTSIAAAREAFGLGNTTGALPIENGGTGKTTVAAARNALGLGNTSGALPIANGGTGQTTVAAARNALGLGNTSGALPVANGGTGATSDIVKVVKYTATWNNLAAGANKDFTGTNLGFSSYPSGYTPIGCVAASSGNSSVIVSFFSASSNGSNLALRIRNVSTAAAQTSGNATATLTIAFIRSGLA